MSSDLAARVNELIWYHTIDLPGGVTTPGWFDTRSALRSMWFPSTLAGKRCLDVGTCDGFWAFEMERRGGTVVGIDVDDPKDRDYPAFVVPSHEIRTPRTFGLAKEVLGSNVERVPLNVYDLSPERLGRFDFTYVGSILLHLRDPIRALEAIRSVTDELLIGDTIWFTGTRLFPSRPVALLAGAGTSRWWTCNLAGLKRMCEAAGFNIIDSGGPFYVPLSNRRGGQRRWRGSLLSTVSTMAVERVGIPHAWIHARARTA